MYMQRIMDAAVATVLRVLELCRGGCRNHPALFIVMGLKSLLKPAQRPISFDAWALPTGKGHANWLVLLLI
jgi:hypothetical protein